MSADKEARNLIIGKLSRNQKQRYEWSERINRHLEPLLILCGLSVLLAFAREAYEWLTPPCVIGAGFYAAWWYFNGRYAEPVKSDIAKQSNSIYEALLHKGLRERIEHDRFYASQEWKILRRRFLRGCKMRSGNYVCDYCQQPINTNDVVTVDHFLPRSKFPELAMEITNLRVACRSCNSSKGSKVLKTRALE